MRVLQVEDDASTAHAVEQMLNAEGHECITTAYGEEAIELARRDDFDLVLLDVMLPDIDGYEVLNRLRRVEVAAPVLFQSGIVAKTFTGEDPGFGTENFLVKPFTRAELAAGIDAAIRHARASAANVDSETNEAPEGPAGPAQPPELGRRRHLRKRTLKAGQIVAHNATFVTDCLILNMSPGGAALRPTEYLHLPATFTLRLQSGERHACRVCWRHGDKVGVRFVDEAPNPG
ncbi:MAG: response regulator [Alphaproteobacteria bacterium]|nr:MAG: response regulator [Alphaproteobacteria bacterium]